MNDNKSQLLRFSPFDEKGPVRIYGSGMLPHWRQDGCTYFVTFRLFDSIPDGVLREWQHDRRKWLEARNLNPDVPDWIEQFKRLSTEDQRSYERYLASRFFEALDQSQGACHLRGREVAAEALKATLHFHGSRLQVGDTVVMPNHVHALMTPQPGFELEDVLHSIKSYSANQINKLLQRRGALWMAEYYDHIVRDAEELRRVQQYIRANPAKAKLGADEYLLHVAEYDLS